MTRYAHTFQDLGIDGQMLLNLTEEDLETDLEVKIRIHRVKLLEHIAAMKNRNSAEIG
jgi:hypothetical protein